MTDRPEPASRLGQLATVPNAVYLEAEAAVRYWEDALVSGEPDEDGSAIPFREGGIWHPWIDLAEGKVADWPQGLEADIHYKVCDAGEYWLTDREGRRLAKWKGHYVPSHFLCHGGNGYGDYIILKVGTDGAIDHWQRPAVDPDEWEPTAQAIEARQRQDGETRLGPEGESAVGNADAPR